MVFLWFSHYNYGKSPFSSSQTVSHYQAGSPSWDDGCRPPEVETARSRMSPACRWTTCWTPGRSVKALVQWIGLRENLNRKPWFLPSNIGVSCKFSRHPILWLVNGDGVSCDSCWLSCWMICWRWSLAYFYSRSPLLGESIGYIYIYILYFLVFLEHIQEYVAI